MPFYRVAMNGLVQGQAVANILWYRSAFPVPDLPTLVQIEDALAAEVEENIWANAVGGMKLTSSIFYTLVDITVDAHSDAGPFLSTTPFIRPVGEAGTRGGATQGPAQTAIFSAVLEPAFGPGVGLPKRGHLKYGPLLDTDILDTGLISGTAQAILNALAANFAANIATELPVSLFFPVRVRLTRVLGVVTALTYRDVSAFVVRPVPSWLHSRQPEA